MWRLYNTDKMTDLDIKNKILELKNDEVKLSAEWDGISKVPNSVAVRVGGGLEEKAMQISCLEAELIRRAKGESSGPVAKPIQLSSSVLKSKGKGKGEE